jgi:hypothetical protein
MGMNELQVDFLRQLPMWPIPLKLMGLFDNNKENAQLSKQGPRELHGEDSSKRRKFDQARYPYGRIH